MQTPLFIPSISGWKANLDWMAQSLRKILLPQRVFMLSAFDVKNMCQETLDLFEQYTERNLLYLDSGGYESYHKQMPWDISNYYEGLSRIRFDILTAFDRIPSLDETNIIDEMKIYLQATNKLVRGGRRTLILHATESTDIFDLQKAVFELRAEFDILGIPETLCGRGTEGVYKVRQIREFMDREGIVKPIHIFGCGKLDFILQFAEAGADIFDANSWIYNVYNNLSPFSKNLAAEKLSTCRCEACLSKKVWSNIAEKRYSHNFLVIKRGMENIRQSIIDNQLIKLIKQAKC